MSHSTITRQEFSTTTAFLRAKRPEHYARKDARTKVYRALYGEPSRPDRNGPENNEHRRLPNNWSFQNAVATFESLAMRQVKGSEKLESNGVFDEKTFAMLERRLDVLGRLAKREERAMAAE